MASHAFRSAFAALILFAATNEVQSVPTPSTSDTCLNWALNQGGMCPKRPYRRSPGPSTYCTETTAVGKGRTIPKISSPCGTSVHFAHTRVALARVHIVRRLPAVRNVPLLQRPVHANPRCVARRRPHPLRFHWPLVHLALLPARVLRPCITLCGLLRQRYRVTTFPLVICLSPACSSIFGYF
jgi:hypothetical protein